MEHSVQSGRREERVPLHALIELRTDDSDEVLEADGLDLSPGGVAMRAAFVPPVGSRLQCQFRCTERDDAVRAEGEVVWAEWRGPQDGCFGMRFLALDTKSATAIRRHVEPDFVSAAEEATNPRPANLRIDGVGAPIEADVLFADAGSIVLEQDLTFLKLGRGVSIDVPGQSGKRGRIASVELRHGPLDVPTLVFGILLDGAREPVPVSVSAAVPSERREHSPVPVNAVAQSLAPASEPQAASAHDASSISEPVRPENTRQSARKLDTPQVVRTRDAAVEAPTDAAEAAEVAALTQRLNPALSALGAALVTWFAVARERLLAFARALSARLKGEGASLREERWPEAKSKLAVQIARVRVLVSTQRDRYAAFRKARQDKQRRTTAPAPRVQRSSVAAQAPRPEARAQKPRNHRFIAIGLAAVGVGLGMYALAPRSGADRIRVHRRAVSESQGTPATQAAVAPTPVPAPAAPEPVAAPPQLPATTPAATPEPSTPAPAPGNLSFGESNVPNGRTFSLRMSGPVENVEGERREDGFTVRVPGRLALDRASPIATSHRAVARAMVLNRGDYAELTVDFLPGLRPKYQIVGKDATLEVTLERL